MANKAEGLRLVIMTVQGDLRLVVGGSGRRGGKLCDYDHAGFWWFLWEPTDSNSSTLFLRLGTDGRERYLYRGFSEMKDLLR